MTTPNPPRTAEVEALARKLRAKAWYPRPDSDWDEPGLIHEDNKEQWRDEARKQLASSEPRTPEALATYFRTEADVLTPYCLGERDAPAIDVSLPAYLREAADHLDRLSREVAELRDLMANAYGSGCASGYGDGYAASAEEITSLQVQVEALSGAVETAAERFEKLAEGCDAMGIQPETAATARKYAAEARAALPAPAKGGE